MLKRLTIIISILLLFFTACALEDPANTDPLPLVSPTEIEANYGDEIQTFQLQCDTNPDNAFLYDEDGDTVTVVMGEDTQFSGNITLDTATGLLTITRSAPYSGSVTFWTEDGNGGSTEADALTVNFDVTEFDSSNQAPVASFPVWDYMVSLPVFPADDANGEYLDTGSTRNSRSVYEISGATTMYLYSFFVETPVISRDSYWVLHTVLYADGEPKDLSDFTYYYQSTASNPPIDESWLKSSDDTPIDIDLLGAPIHGDISSYGYDLTVTYIFSDPDGIVDNSLYQWFRCASADVEGSEIPGATSKIYHTEVDDNHQFLKIEITPVDDSGLHGSPVKSDASGQINGPS